MKTFDIATQTTPVEAFSFSGNQVDRANAHNCVRVFRFRYVGNVSALPKYILLAIRAAGYTAHYLGGTTYRYSVIGLAVTTPDDERRALNSVWWGIANLKYIRERATMAFNLFPELRSEFIPRLVALELEAR